MVANRDEAQVLQVSAPTAAMAAFVTSSAVSTTRKCVQRQDCLLEAQPRAQCRRRNPRAVRRRRPCSTRALDAAMIQVGCHSYQSPQTACSPKPKFAMRPLLLVLWTCAPPLAESLWRSSVRYAGDMPVMEYNDHADSISVEIEMRDIMRGDHPAHAHSMDDVNLLLDDGGGQVLGGCCDPSCTFLHLLGLVINAVCWASCAAVRLCEEACGATAQSRQSNCTAGADTEACAGGDQPCEDARQPVPQQGAKPATATAAVPCHQRLLCIVNSTWPAQVQLAVADLHGAACSRRGSRRGAQLRRTAQRRCGPGTRPPSGRRWICWSARRQQNDGQECHGWPKRVAAPMLLLVLVQAERYGKAKPHRQCWSRRGQSGQQSLADTWVLLRP